MENRHSTYPLLTIFAILLLMVVSTSAMAVARGTYLYNLSGFTGTIPYNWVRPFVDRQKNEVYVSNGQDRSVRVFNENGMEIYNFGDDENLGAVVDGSVDEEGNIILLSMKIEGGRGKYVILQCNFRGEVISTIEIKDLPPEFSDFATHRLIYRDGSLYLADLASMKIVETDANGRFKKGYDLAQLAGLNEKEREGASIVGFYVAPDRNIFFTIPVLFRAYKLFPDGQTVSFGRKGSSPGRFNIIAGIASDEKGYIYIVDKLRSVVMIFDKDFNFQSEFGYRGGRPENLIAPNQIEVDGKGRVYITQTRGRGVSVFKVNYD